MTPVFLSRPETCTEEKVKNFYTNGKKRGRYTYEEDHVPKVFAFYHKDYIYERKNFVGMSGEGLPNGSAAQKHGGGATHFSVATRGLVTMMVNYEDVRKLEILSPVKVVPSSCRFNGFDPNVVCFTLADATKEKKFAIGILMSKPSRRHPSNQCQILLV